MDSTSDPATQFSANITRLIADIEACIQSHGGLREREARLQRLAFQERRRQAECLAARLAAGTAEWLHLDGDARRILDSLTLSLAYFQGTGDTLQGQASAGGLSLESVP